VPDIRAAIVSGREEIPAKVMSKDGVHDITLYVRGLSDEEKTIIKEGCLMNYYAALNAST
jgi:aconitate hydratase